MSNESIIESLDRDGYAWLPGVLAANQVAELTRSCAQALSIPDVGVLANDGPAYGARNLLSLWPEAITLACEPALAIALRSVMGPTTGVVRGLYFDKPPGHTWALPWHRDQTIAVKEHRSREVFRKPTVKAGVPHVEAPTRLLETMLTARIHLDAMTPENGPLRVTPGSHDISVSEPRPAVELRCEAGDVLLMRPLLLHSSGHSSSNAGHRRIVHFEYAPSPNLSDGYEWHTFQTLTNFEPKV